MAKGDKSYTRESFERVRCYMGVIVLQTNSEDKEPEEIYTLCKKHWNIEIVYNYFKNKVGYVSPHEKDYYKTQGLAFIMLLHSMLYYEIVERKQQIDTNILIIEPQAKWQQVDVIIISPLAYSSILREWKDKLICPTYILKNILMELMEG